MLLLQLDESTVENAVNDGHFPSREACPCYAISMGTELVYEAATVVLLANGARKTGPVAESVFGEVTCDVPISYGQKYGPVDAKALPPGTALQDALWMCLYDPSAKLGMANTAEVLARRAEAEAKGCEVIDLRDQP